MSGGEPSSAGEARPRGRAPLAQGTVIRVPGGSTWYVVIEDVGLRYTSPESLPQMWVVDVDRGVEHATTAPRPDDMTDRWLIVPGVRGVRCAECDRAWLVIPDIATMGWCEPCAQVLRDEDAAEPVVDWRHR